MANLLRSLPRISQLSRIFSTEPAERYIVVGAERAHPIQRVEHDLHYLYVPHPDFIDTMIAYAMNEWVFSAINKLSETAASAELMVLDRGTNRERFEKHGLEKLLGRFGRPNDHQDSYEFLEAHFAYLDLTGNSYWWWGSGDDGLPGEVHVLDPSKVEIKAGANRTIAAYVYRDYGHEMPFNPLEVTHFKRYNPYNRYYGLSPIQALKTTVRADTHMARWNADFFDDGHGVPGGILVLPKNTPRDDAQRIERELNAKHGGGRRQAMVATGDPGSAVWLDAGLKPHEMDFEKGRLLSRKSVYEALNLPLGIMSEASTEAHAIVSQRQFFEAIELRHIRTQRKINSDAMDFWPKAHDRIAQFEKISTRATDWRRESLKLRSLGDYMTIDEVRAQEFNLPPLEEGENVANQRTNAPRLGGATGAPRGTGPDQPRLGQGDESPQGLHQPD